MKRKAKDLIFISHINRDGSGTTEVPYAYLQEMLTNPYMKDEDFELKRLSLSEDTYIAFNFNAFVIFGSYSVITIFELWEPQ